MIKENYEAPVMETVLFESDDVITTSNKWALSNNENELEDVEW